MGSSPVHRSPNHAVRVFWSRQTLENSKHSSRAQHTEYFTVTSTRKPKTKLSSVEKRSQGAWEPIQSTTATCLLISRVLGGVSQKTAIIECLGSRRASHGASDASRSTTRPAGIPIQYTHALNRFCLRYPFSAARGQSSYRHAGLILCNTWLSRRATCIAETDGFQQESGEIPGPR